MVETTANPNEGMSKLKDILDSIGSDSGGVKNLLKVDYGEGSKLESSLGELKKFASKQTDYLQKMVKFQDDALRAKRLADVGQAETEKLQSIDKPVKESSVLAAAAGGFLSGALGPILGQLLLTGLTGLTKLVKPGGARPEGKAGSIPEAIKSSDTPPSKAGSMPEAIKSSDTPPSKAGDATTPKLKEAPKFKVGDIQKLPNGDTIKLTDSGWKSEVTGKYVKAPKLAEVPVKPPTISTSELKPSTLEAPALESAGRGRGLGLAGRAASGIARVALGPELFLAQLLLQPSAIADATISGQQTKELYTVIDMFARKGIAAIPEVKNEIKSKEYLINYDPNSEQGQALNWILKSSNKELSNFISLVMRNNPDINPFNNLTNPAYVTQRAMETSLFGPDRDRQRGTLGDRSILQTTPSVPTVPGTANQPQVVVVPSPASSPSNVTTNSNNTQNITIQKTQDPAVSLGLQMLGGGSEDIPIFNWGY